MSSVKTLECNRGLNEFILSYPGKALGEDFKIHQKIFSCRLNILGSCISNVWRVPSGTVDEITLALDYESAIKTASWLISMILSQKQGGVLCINDGAESKMVMFRVFGRRRTNTTLKEMEKIRFWHFSSPGQFYRPIRKDRLRLEVLHDDFKVRRNWLLATSDARGIMRLALTLLRHAKSRGEVSGMVFGQARHQVPIDYDSCWFTINIVGGAK